MPRIKIYDTVSRHAGKYKKGDPMKKNLLLLVFCAIALSAASVSLAMPGNVAKTTDHKTSQIEAEPLAGKVLQTMDSGGYTYVNIQKKNGEKVWVAAPVATVIVGTEVSFKGGMEMVDFESKSLKRKFDRILFADAIISDDATAKGISGGSKAAVLEKDSKISVAKATGANAYTIQEIFAKSARLDKKKVVVRGKIIKVSAGIMGKNWIHIQDGTGSQAKKNHNLVCTSKDMAVVGDIVTITGVLAKDKDFGGGYKYSAILEESTIKK